MSLHPIEYLIYIAMKQKDIRIAQERQQTLSFKRDEAQKTLRG